MNILKFLKSKNWFYLFSRATLFVGIGLVVFSFGLLAIALYPQIWYQVNTSASDSELSSLVLQTDTLSEESKDSGGEGSLGLPPFDESLPLENTLLIPSIGVNGPINENEDAHKGLLKGIWRVNDWGTPLDDTTIIIAAHRFGYISWSKQFRETNSFYNLPKSRVGDRVHIIWEQRKYEYEVYRVEEGTQITDYDADLILYTCKMYNSPIRVFRYLNRVQ